MAVFGNFYKCLLDPKKDAFARLGLQHARVIDGILMGSDAHVLFKVALATWIDENDGIEHTEGKMFSHDLLKKMALGKWKRLKFTEKMVEFYASYSQAEPTEVAFYSGEIKEGNEYYEWKIDGTRKMITLDAGTDKERTEEFTFKFPNLDAVIPTSWDSSFALVPFCPELLQNLTECFKHSISPAQVKLSFTSNHKDDAGLGYPKKAILVQPNIVDDWGRNSTASSDFGIIMPVAPKFY